jgi:hypothetical protein
MFKDMYKLKFMPEIKMHPTFHVSLFKPFKKNTLWHDHKQMIRPPSDLVGGHFDYEGEDIFKCKKSKKKWVFGEMARKS